MRPCYFTKVGKYKVLIPGCFGSMHRDDLEMCTCNRAKHKKDMEDRVELLEKQVKELIEQMAVISYDNTRRGL